MPTGVIESLDHEARGITRLDGKTILVEGALPGAVSYAHLGTDAEYAAGQVEPRRVTGTEELAMCAKPFPKLRRATLMRTLSNGDKQIRSQRTIPIAASLRLQGVFGFRIGQFVFVVGKRGNDLGTSAQNPDRSTVPVGCEQLAGWQITEIDRHRIALRRL